MVINSIFSGEKFPVQVDRAHYLRRLGYPKNYEVPEIIAQQMNEAAGWYAEHASPWLSVYEVNVSLKNDQLELNGYKTNAPKIFKRFKKYEVTTALLIAATAGPEVDKQIAGLWSSDHPDRSFFLDSYASSVTESLIEAAVKEIKTWAGYKNLKVLSRYSPGYPGWELSEQKVLMQIISEQESGELPVSLTEANLLNPLKSQLSLVGLYATEESEPLKEVACLTCTFDNCACRKKEMYIKNK